LSDLLAAILWEAADVGAFWRLLGRGCSELGVSIFPTKWASKELLRVFQPHDRHVFFFRWVTC
jgi:hypothetical protein